MWWREQDAHVYQSLAWIDVGYFIGLLKVGDAGNE